MFVRYYFVPGKKVAWAAAAPHTNVTPASPLVENMGRAPDARTLLRAGERAHPFFPGQAGYPPSPPTT